MAAVNANMFGAAVVGDLPSRPTSSLMLLPLNLIALIVSQLDDVADLSRLCCTCRVLNYMTLPHLYKNLTLTSHDRIRYRDDRTGERMSSSSFSMGLNTVITQNVGLLVRSVRLRGGWREDGLEEHARAGRVPDSSMMLNIAVRAAVDRMTELESFSWELNTKMLETVYVGLSQLPKLTSLTIRFPSTRHPQPTTTIPGMPHLRALKIADIDPLCYPDDISTLLMRSKKLRELEMHWSPRIRQCRGPSVTLHDYFGKCITAKSPLVIRKLSLHNLYALHTEHLEMAIDRTALEEVTMLSSLTPFDEIFDTGWLAPKAYTSRIKSLRHDQLNKRLCEFLECLCEIEKLYFVNPVQDPEGYVNSPRRRPTSSSVSKHQGHGNESGIGALPSSTAISASTSGAVPQSLAATAASQALLRDAYLRAVTITHGLRLRHLLLSPCWSLSGSVIARLVRACPNLEQLAFATDTSSFETLRLLLPFLRKLLALRLLIPTSGNASAAPVTPRTVPAPSVLQTHGYSPTLGNTSPGAVEDNCHSQTPATVNTIAEVVDLDDRIHCEIISAYLADKEIFSNLKVIGMGWKAWELGRFYTIHSDPAISPGLSEDGERDCGNNANRIVPPIAAGEPGPAMASIGGIRATCSSQEPAAQIWSSPSPTLGKRKERDHDTSNLSTDSHGNSPRHGHENAALLRIDPSNYPTTSGRRLSEAARAEIAGYLRDVSAVNVVWRRHVRRVGWDVLRHWEIWSLDVQEI